MSRMTRNGRALLTLAAGAVTLLVAGVIYAWSILKAPFETVFGWSGSSLALTFTFAFCFFCIGGLSAGILRKRFRPRQLMVLSALLTFLGFFLVSRLSGAHIRHLYLFYGVLCGYGIGVVYNTVVSTVSLWFRDRPGLCSGVLMLCFGLSSLVFGGLATGINASSPQGWRVTFLVLGCLSGAVFLLASRLIAPPEDGPERSVEAADPSAGRREYTTGEMLRTGSFFRFFLYSTLCSMVGNCVFSFAFDFALSLGAAVTLATALTGIFSISNALGRILCGLLYDSLGRRRTMLLANLFTLAAPLLAALACGLSSLPLGVGALLLLGVSYGCCPTITAAFTSEFYGRKHYSQNFGVMNSVLIPASFAAPAVSRIAGIAGGYTAVFLILALCAALAFLLNVGLREP